jgi:SAM-dependent methyltransferase
MVDRLGKRGTEVVSVEPLPEGAASIASAGGVVFCSTLQDLKLPSNSIPAISLFDVLEHLEDPTVLLQEIHRVLKPGGFLLVSVPAFQFLWSAEDEALGHFRRYSKASLKNLMGSEGFSVLSTRYFFASLVPLAYLIRTLPYRLRINGSSTDVISRNASRLAPNKIVNSLAGFMLGLELRLARLFPLPFGLSVFAFGEKVEKTTNDLDRVF